MIKLRPYQKRDYKQILELFKENDSVLYQCPTGGGKSVVIEKLILDHKKEKTLVLAHKRELVFQLKNRLEKNGLKVGVIIGSIEENLDSNIVIGSVRTVTRDKRIQTILDKKFDNVVVDEAHHIRTASYEKVLDQYKFQNPKLKIFGVTATPYRMDGKSLGDYFQVLLISDDIKSLQDQGFLANYKLFHTPIHELEEKVKMSGRDYQITSLSQFMMNPEILEHLVDSYEEKGDDQQMIVFCVDKKHAREVQSVYRKRGHKSLGHIDSDTKLDKRAQILQDFADDKIKIITCIETLTEGVDLPETKVVQLARPTKSLILYLQMVGRGLRPKQDGSECIILDNAGCVIEHKSPASPREWSLDPSINPNDPGKKNKVVGKRKDGSLTDDLDELGLELIELTEEEYVNKIEGGIERAQQENDDIDRKCKEILIEIGELIIEKSKSKLIKVDKNEIINKWFTPTEINFKRSKNGKDALQINFDIRDQDIAVNLDRWASWTDKTEKKHFQVLLGDIAKLLLNKKFTKSLVNKFNKIQELLSEKHNIRDLEQKKRQFEEKQKQLKLEQHLTKNNVIELVGDNEIRLQRWFRDHWGYVNKMEFSRNKLMATNEVTFHKSNGSTITLTTKKDRVLDMLNSVEWK